MKQKNFDRLAQIIRRKATQLGFRQLVKQSPRIISLAAPNEKFRLEVTLNNHIVVPPLPLILSVQVYEDSFWALLFPDPCILSEKTVEAALTLANEANRELYRGTALGRFWVDDDPEHLDFAYDLYLKEEMLEACPEEVAKQLFDVPFAHFNDLHVPLTMLAAGTWDSATALRYFRQLREDGFVDNEEYGLW